MKTTPLLAVGIAVVVAGMITTLVAVNLLPPRLDDDKGFVEERCGVLHTRPPPYRLVCDELTVVSAVQCAAQRWEARLNRRSLFEIEVPAVVPPAVEYETGVVLVSRQNSDDGLAQLHWDDGCTIHSARVFLPRHVDPEQLCDFMDHELGHFFALAHDLDTHSLMYPFRRRVTGKITSADVMRVRAMLLGAR